MDRVLTFPRHNFAGGLGELVAAVREEPYRYVFDFQGLLKSGFTARLARSESRIGPSYHREGTGWFYTEIAGVRNKERHAVDEAMDFARHFGIESSEIRFPVSFPKVDVVAAADKPRIGYLPCSRWTTKNWPPQQFAQLIKKLSHEVGGTAYLFGGKSDIDTCNRIEQEAGVSVENLCGKTSMAELGGYLQELDLLITVDSGPMHMAVAAGTPVLAIFGSTDPMRTGPYGSGSRVVSHGGLSCQPCRSRRCLRPGRDLACLTQLHPDRVADVACSMLPH